MGYDDEAKQMMVRLEEKLSPGLGEMLANEAVRLGPEALKLLLRFPEALVYAGVRRWVRKVALRMPPEDTVPIVLEALSHPDWRIFEIARDVLAGMGTDVRDALLESFANCPSPGGRLQTLYCLHRLADPLSGAGSGDAGLIPHIESAARSDASEDVRAAAVVALSRCEAEGVNDTIVAALADEAEAVRLQAAKAAGRLRLKAAVPQLLEMLADEDPDVRADAIYALDRIGDVTAAGAVAACLADADWYVRWTAAKALERLWQAENVEPLTRACDDGHPLVAAAATETLAAKAPR